MKEESPIKPRKLPTQARSRVTYDAILKATAQVLAREGVDSVNTNHVAAVAGVSIGSLYQYFPNKESMMQALIDSYADKFVQHLQGYLGQLSQEPAPDAIRSYVRAMLSLPRENPELHRAFVLVVFKLGHASIRDLEEKLLFVVRAYLETQRHRILPQDLELATFILVTTVESVTNIALLKHPDYILSETFEIELSSIITRYLFGS